jgi:plasmid stabilization system protein ParE
MADYRLSRRAASDLLAIYAHTEAMFGAYQAEAYHAGFERTFGLVADFPASAHQRKSLPLAIAGFGSNPIMCFTAKKKDMSLSAPSSMSR